MRTESEIAAPPAAASTPPGNDLTPRARELLTLLSAAPTCPTFEQMRVALGCASKHNVARLVSQLEERGYIHRRPRRARAISVLRPLPAACVQPQAKESASGDATVELPLLGPVPAPGSYPFRDHRSCADWVVQ